MSGIPVSSQAEVIDGETPGGLPSGSVLNIYDSCNLLAQGVNDSRFRSVLVQAAPGNTGTLLVGYRTNNPRSPAPVEFDAIDGRWYDLKKVVVKLGATGDKAVFIAAR